MQPETKAHTIQALWWHLPDVKDVVSVGGVDEWGRIASFSSTGPTADGQMKPDLVAQGRGVYIPVIYGSDLSTYTSNGNGTSFSTP